MTTNFNFCGKVIAVTSAFSGIEFAAAEILATRDAKVSTNEVQENALTEVAERREKHGALVLAEASMLETLLGLMPGSGKQSTSSVSWTEHSRWLASYRRASTPTESRNRKTMIGTS